MKRTLRYGLDIWEYYGVVPTQVLIYIGNSPLKMSNKLQINTPFSFLSYGFRIIDTSLIPAEIFLSSPDPEVNLLAILGKSDNPETVLEEVLKRIDLFSDSTEKLSVSLA